MISNDLRSSNWPVPIWYQLEIAPYFVQLTCTNSVPSRNCSIFCPNCHKLMLHEVNWKFFFLFQSLIRLYSFAFGRTQKWFLFMKTPCCKCSFLFLTRKKKGDRKHQTGRRICSTSFNFHLKRWLIFIRPMLAFPEP